MAHFDWRLSIPMLEGATTTQHLLEIITKSHCFDIHPLVPVFYRSKGTMDTIDSTLLSTPHDRQRRRQRKISKEDLQRARRYGMVMPGKRKGTKRYYHAGRVLVYNEKTKKGKTSFGKPSNSKARKSGTSAVNPTLLQKSIEHDTRAARQQQKILKHHVSQKRGEWKSHSVLVIDMSGSMRTDDVNGARCRSDGVWMVLARDFIKRQLENKTVGVYDLVSIILMKEEPTVLCRFEPSTWVLYNRLVDLREWTTAKPEGHGNYLPALEVASKLLDTNTSTGCSLALFFFSDGKPSDPLHDRPRISQMMGEIAAKYGRRLVISCVGMADNKKEDFSVLEGMVNEAKEFDISATLYKPSLSTDALSSIVSTLTSSLTVSRTELTELDTGRARLVRPNISRERRNAQNDDVPTSEDWRVFMASSNHMYPERVYMWNSRQNDFATLLDPRCIGCYDMVGVDYGDGQYTADKKKGKLCAGCKAVFICHQCSENEDHDCEAASHDRRNGLISLKSLPSFNFAYKKHAFGEGAERLAFKFRFVSADGKSFVGPKMVAKESRFVDDDIDDGVDDTEQYLLSNKFSYHRQFARTQAIASRFANIYNTAIDELPGQFQNCSKRFEKRLRSYPRIRFLDPMIFELKEDDGNGHIKAFNVLVEPMIETGYRKFNNNFGKVADAPRFDVFQSNPLSDSSLRNLSTSHGSGSVDVNFLLGIKAAMPEASGTKRGGPQTLTGQFDMLRIVEEEDEEDEDESDEDSVCDCNEDKEGYEKKDDIEHLFEWSENQEHTFASPERSFGKIPDEEFAQAFSHFTYVRSGGQLMVVDLQGSLVRHEETDTSEFILTDPAIHKRKFRRGRRLFKGVSFGRTDRGREGIYAFFDTHECNDACRLLGLRPKVRKERNNN